MVVTRLTQWTDVLNAARTTAWKGDTSIHPTPEWKKKILLAEHSPIRALVFEWTFTDIPYFSSVHLSRHKIGIEHFVSSQRPETTGVPRDKLPQDSLVNHKCIANAQAIISMCKMRLCVKAAKETRDVVHELVRGLEKIEPELASVCVPSCVYRGFCPEMRSCGYYTTKTFDKQIEAYRG